MTHLKADFDGLTNRPALPDAYLMLQRRWNVGTHLLCGNKAGFQLQESREPSIRSAEGCGAAEQCGIARALERDYAERNDAEAY